MSETEPIVPRPLTMLLFGFVVPLGLVAAVFAFAGEQPFMGVLLAIAAVIVSVLWRVHRRVDAVLAHLQADDTSVSDSN